MPLKKRRSRQRSAFGADSRRIHDLHPSHAQLRKCMLAKPLLAVADSASGTEPGVVARLDSFLSGMLERVQEYCQKQLCVAVSLVTDSQPHAWQELPAAFERYRSVLTYQLGAQDEMLLGEIAFFDQAMPDHPVWDGSADALLSSLESAFEYRQKDSFDQLLQTLLQGLLACGNPVQKIELYHRLCLFFLERVAAAGRQKDFFDRFHGYAAFTMPYEQWDSSLPSLFSKIGRLAF